MDLLKVARDNKTKAAREAWLERMGARMAQEPSRFADASAEVRRGPLRLHIIFRAHPEGVSVVAWSVQFVPEGEDEVWADDLVRGSGMEPPPDVWDRAVEKLQELLAECREFMQKLERAYQQAEEATS